MQPGRKIWEKVWGQVAAPRVSEERLEKWLQEVRSKLPVPVFWLLGKSQSGKTSLIRGLTGNSRVEIGNGFTPCTRTAQVYPFPAESDCLLRFLDTRGLGEVDYDPRDDIALFQNQAHLLIVVMKAMDHAQHPVLEALCRIRDEHPHWPVIVAQTSLHEGYLSIDQPHIEPYPYGATLLPPTIPPDLVRSLLAQREAFTRLQIPAQFVPLDFTLPEDGFQPVDYGIEALWAAIESALPLGLRGMLQQLDETRRTLRDMHLRAAQPHIVSYALIAGGAAACTPIPWIDMPLIVGIQAKMFHTVASIYHQEMNSQRVAEMASTLGIGFLGRLGARELLKAVPGLGGAVSGLYTAAATYALGLTFCAYFSFARDGALPDKDELRRIYDTHFREGREKLRSYLERLPKTPQDPA